MLGGIIFIVVIGLMILGYKLLSNHLQGYEKNGVFYNYTEIQYVNLGSFIKLDNEWFKVIFLSSRYASTMTVNLENEETKEVKDITVSPNYRIKYKVYQSI